MAGAPAAAGQIAESVCAGHPDKVADQISDAVLDAYLAGDRAGRVHCEVLVTRGVVVMTGQVTAGVDVDVEAVARGVLRDVGYLDARRHGLAADDCRVEVLLDRQSPEIGRAVGLGGAGDSGIVYGYACDETAELMPLSCVLAHDIARRISAGEPGGSGPRLGPDGKVQVQLVQGREGPAAGVVLSVQHRSETPLDEVRDFVRDAIVGPALAARGAHVGSLVINPAGTFLSGGTAADSGLTGRKLMVDTYGGLARHGGGCFSGKDPTKVDRSGAYAARYLAANVVAAGLARRCQVGIAYAIGQPDPVWFDVDCMGTGTVDAGRLDRLREVLLRAVDLRVGPLLDRLGLRAVRYRPTATFGHFGRPAEGFPWEDRDLAGKIRDSGLGGDR